MAEQKVVTLVCDGCGAVDDTVRTRTLGNLRGEVCGVCWATVESIVGSWRTTAARRRKAG